MLAVDECKGDDLSHLYSQLSNGLSDSRGHIMDATCTSHPHGIEIMVNITRSDDHHDAFAHQGAELLRVEDPSGSATEVGMGQATNKNDQSTRVGNTVERRRDGVGQNEMG